MSTLTFAATFDSLDDIRTFVGDQARQAGFGPREVYSIQLATDEAASNVIEHAYGGNASETFDIDCEFRNKRLTVTIQDHGRAFDPGQVPEPDLKADLPDRKIGGLGIYLMRKLMDEVHYKSGRGSNVLTLVKRRP